MSQILESVRLALASIWSNKLRSMLTLLGNIVAVSSIITVVALITGVNQAVTDAIVSDLGADSLTIQRMGITQNEDEFERMRNNPQVTLEDALELIVGEIQDEYDAEVVALCINLGQPEDDFQEILDKDTDPWGIKVAKVEIKHIDLPQEMHPAVGSGPHPDRLVAGRTGLACARDPVELDRAGRAAEAVTDGPDGPHWTCRNGGSFGLMNGVGPAGAKCWRWPPRPVCKC